MRQLTADTVIKIRKSRPAKKPLTAETKICLSKIKGLKEWHSQLVKDDDEVGDVHHWPSDDKDHRKQPDGSWPVVGSEKDVVGKEKEEPETKNGRHDWTSKVPGWLDFEKNKVKISVEYQGKRVEMDIPEELLREPNQQKMTDEAYQRNTQDLKKQIQYLHDFNFDKATPEQVSDALRLMGKVNAAAFKKEGRVGELSPEEEKRSTKIYKQAKDVFVPKLVDYYVKHKMQVLITPRSHIVFFNNPVTKVQVSFHGYKGPRPAGIEPATKGTWSNIKNSYVYKSKQDADRIDPIVKAYLNSHTKDNLINTSKGFIVKDMEAKKTEYLIEWGDGQFELQEFGSIADVHQFWKEVDEEGIMPIESIKNYETDEVVEHY